MSNVKSFEKANFEARKTEQVNNILNDVETVNFSLTAAKVLTFLYYLISFFAVVEMVAALSFYGMTLFDATILCVAVAVALAFLFHWKLHTLLDLTTKGLIFAKGSHSKSMKRNVTTLLAVSIVLLCFAACIVFFVGKKGFEGYRAKQYDIAHTLPKDSTNTPKVNPIDATTLANKNGKISGYKLEQLAEVTKAQSQLVNAQNGSNAAQIQGEIEKKKAYDNTTQMISSTVGVSAFVIEILLLLLAFAVANSKHSATIETQATPTPTPTPTPAPAPQQPLNDLERLNEIMAKRLALLEAQINAQNTPKTPQIFDAPTQPFSENSTIVERKRIGFYNDVPLNDVRLNDVRLNDVQKSDNEVITNTKKCKCCGKEFTPNAPRHVFCSDQCRIEYWENGKQAKVKFKPKKA